MRTKELLLATVVLAEACSVQSCGKNQAEVQLSKPDHVEGYKTGFKIPQEIEALEEQCKQRIKKALACEGYVFYQSEKGAFRETDISANGKIVFLSDELACVRGEISACTAVALQYEEGTMVNGFTVAGLCVPKEFIIKNGLDSQKNLSGDVDLSKRIEERGGF
ncbi:MAG: hypothetical protein AAB739_01195 [Patescibacteria group bacterium]